MRGAILRLGIVVLVHAGAQFGETKPPEGDRKNRIPSFDNRIFKNRTRRCIKLLEDVDELEHLNKEPTSSEFEEIPIRQSEEDLRGDVKEVKEITGVNRQSRFRRFLRCILGRSDKPVEIVSYRNTGEGVESASDENDRQGEVCSNTVELEPIKKKTASITGGLTEIGTVRLPRKVQINVDPHEYLAIPGPSKVVEKMIAKIEELEELEEEIVGDGCTTKVTGSKTSRWNIIKKTKNMVTKV